MNQINESCLAQKRFKFGQKKQSRLGHYHTEVNHFVFKLWLKLKFWQEFWFLELEIGF